MRVNMLLNRANNEVEMFRRNADHMSVNFASSMRRATDEVREMGSRVSSATDEVNRLSRTEVGDIFSRARRGADDLRSSAGRADAEVRGIHDADVKIMAQDHVSPVVDGISSKIGALAAAAGALVIGGGVKDAMFDGVGDYYSAAARIAPYTTDAQRSSVLSLNDKMYVQDIIPNRAEGASNIADAAPLVKDKSQLNEFVTESNKIQFIRPDAGMEEINRALSQSSNSFKESYSQVADSMMYAYKEVGDKQQDLFDTFWEYSPYFASARTNSAQMSNYLTQTVKAGAFNFDKPADFFKETFGVKALNTGDMATYFQSRGAGKDQAQKQAQAFTDDINSGDKQRAQGAIAALVADLASQTRADLKKSLVTLGSGAGEDNADSILKTYGVAFQKPPEMAGTTDQLVKRQQDANPMTELNRTRNEVDLLLQNLGATMSTELLPIVREFKGLLDENKDSITSLFGTLTSGITAAMGIYKDNFKAINTGLLLIVGTIAAVKAVKFGAGVVGDVKSGVDWTRQKAGKVRGLFKRKGTEEEPPDEAAGDRRRFNVRRWNGSGGSGAGGIQRLASMTVYAGTVIINGGNSGGSSGGDGGKGGRRRGPVRNGRRLPRSVTNRNHSNRNADGSINGRRRLPSTPPTGEPSGGDPPPTRNGRVTYRNGRVFPRPPVPPPEPPIPPRTSWLSKVGGTLGKGAKYLKPAAKAAGIVGTVATVGMGAYDLYQASKEGGLKEGLSTKGGSMAGSIGGGVVGGIIGSALGPIGTAVGAAAGSWVGEKLGTMVDESGLTRKAVDIASSAIDKTTSFFKSTGSAIGDFFTGKSEPASAAVTTGVSAITFGAMTPARQEEIKKVMGGFVKDVGQKGLVNAVKDSFDGPVGQKLTGLKDKVVGIFKGSGADKAKKDIADVGASSDKTKKQAQDMGVSATKSAKDISGGANQASSSIKSVGGSARQAAAETKSHLEQIAGIVGKGSTWGSNLIDMLVGGIRSKFPALSGVVSQAAGIIGNFLGFHSPTKEGPASDSDTWAPNFINMFADGLRPDRVRQRMNGIANELKPPGSAGTITMAKSLSSAPVTKAGTVTIQNINFDFGQLAQGVTNFKEFAQMLNSAEGRRLISTVMNQELLNALENGG